MIDYLIKYSNAHKNYKKHHYRMDSDRVQSVTRLILIFSILILSVNLHQYNIKEYWI